MTGVRPKPATKAKALLKKLRLLKNAIEMLIWLFVGNTCLCDDIL
jgi:hypothetical protein